jgi:hypothetical protein
MYQVTIIFNPGGSNRFEIPTIPRVGEEVAVVHGNGEEDVYKVTRVRHRAYRCGIAPGAYSHESAAMIWGDLVDSGTHCPFIT